MYFVTISPQVLSSATLCHILHPQIAEVEPGVEQKDYNHGDLLFRKLV